MKVYSFALLTLVLSLHSIIFSQNQTSSASEEKNALRTYALKINVDDMKKAVAFYVDKLGFEIEKKSDLQITLKTNDRVKLILNKVKRLRKVKPGDTGVVLTLQVNDLDQAIEKMKSAGIEFAETERRKEGVGNAISIRDPFGRDISLMHQTIVKVEPFKEPKLYNFGVCVSDMSAGRDFYSHKLGFVERSERYLPLDMPLGHEDKSFGFMLHQRPNVRSIINTYPKESPFYIMVFETADLQKTLDEMQRKGIKIVDKKLLKNKKPEMVVIEDPFGNISEIIAAN